LRKADTLGDTAKQELGRWASNQVENNHLPFPSRERAMLRFRQMKALEKFASVHANVTNQFASRLFRSITAATSPRARPTRPNAQQHWLSGKSSLS
jgi:putative transposase